MNNDRRTQIECVINNVGILEQDATAIRKIIEHILSEEQAARDGMPDNLMDSENAVNSDNACDLLNQALDNFDNALGEIAEAREALIDASN